MVKCYMIRFSLKDFGTHYFLKNTYLFDITERNWKGERQRGKETPLVSTASPLVKPLPTRAMDRRLAPGSLHRETCVLVRRGPTWPCDSLLCKQMNLKCQHFYSWRTELHFFPIWNKLCKYKWVVWDTKIIWKDCVITITGCSFMWLLV